MKIKQKSILNLLRSKELNNKPNYRINLSIVRNIVCSDQTKYEKVWYKKGQHSFDYDNKRIYSNKKRTCFTICGHNNKPQMIYQLSNEGNNKNKVEDFLTFSCPLEHVNQDNQVNRPFFLGLYTNGTLVRRDLDTGVVLQKVSLDKKYKFRYLAWNTVGESVVVKSTFNSTASEEAVILCLLVFDVYPLKFSGLIEIRKSIFGNDVIAAELSYDVLLVTHRSKFIKMYSWYHLQQQEEFMEIQSSGGLNENGTEGTLMNSNYIKECPPELLRIQCEGSRLTIGGHPWHYIITPPKCQGSSFQVKNLITHNLAENGELSFYSTSLEPDNCSFLFDDSGRVIHSGSDTISVYNLVELDNGCSKLQLQFTFDRSTLMKDCKENVCLPGSNVTRSGRRVSRVRPDDTVDGAYEFIQGIDYEDDLDLLCVTTAQLTGSEYLATVCLLDNQTGELVKKVQLPETWNDWNQHRVIVDLDYIVHIEDGDNYHVCYVHRIHR